MSDVETEIEGWLKSQGVKPPRKLTTRIPIVRHPDNVETSWLLDNVQGFQMWAESNALLRPGEYPYQAWLAAILTEYGGQVDNGGHDQWIVNFEFDKLQLKAVGFGLRLLGLNDFHTIHSRYMKYSTGVMAFLRKLGGFGPRDQASYDADDAFSEIGSEKLFEAIAEWLRTTGGLQELSPSELEAEYARIVKAKAQPTR